MGRNFITVLVEINTFSPRISVGKIDREVPAVCSRSTSIFRGSERKRGYFRVSHPPIRFSLQLSLTFSISLSPLLSLLSSRLRRTSKFSSPSCLRSFSGSRHIADIMHDPAVEYPHLTSAIVSRLSKATAWANTGDSVTRIGSSCEIERNERGKRGDP